MLSWEEIRQGLIDRGWDDEETWDKAKRKHLDELRQMAEWNDLPTQEKARYQLMLTIDRPKQKDTAWNKARRIMAGNVEGLLSPITEIGAVHKKAKEHIKEQGPLVKMQAASSEPLMMAGVFPKAAEMVEGMTEFIRPDTGPETQSQAFIEGLLSAPGQLAGLAPYVTAYGGIVGGLAAKRAIGAAGEEDATPEEVAIQGLIGAAEGALFKGVGKLAGQAGKAAKKVSVARGTHALGAGGIGATSSLADQLFDKDQKRIDFGDVAANAATLAILGMFGKGDYEGAKYNKALLKRIGWETEAIVKKAGLEKEWKQLQEYDKITVPTKYRLIAAKATREGYDPRKLVQEYAKETKLEDEQKRVPIDEDVLERAEQERPEPIAEEMPTREPTAEERPEPQWMTFNFESLKRDVPEVTFDLQDGGTATIGWSRGRGKKREGRGFVVTIKNTNGDVLSEKTYRKLKNVKDVLAKSESGFTSRRSGGTVYAQYENTVYGATSERINGEVRRFFDGSRVAERIGGGVEALRGGVRRMFGLPEAEKPGGIGALDVTESLAKMAGVPYGEGGMRIKGALGRFFPWLKGVSPNGIMIRLKDLSNYPIMLHEIAHKFFEVDLSRVKKNLTPEAQAELRQRSLEVNGDRPELDPLSEGFALWFSDSVVDGVPPVWAPSMARQFDAFSAEYPQVQRFMTTANEMIEQYKAQPPHVQSQGMIAYPQKRTLPTKKEVISGIRQVFFDPYSAVEDMVESQLARHQWAESVMADPRNIMVMIDKNGGMVIRDSAFNGVMSAKEAKRLSKGLYRVFKDNQIDGTNFERFGAFYLDYAQKTAYDYLLKERQAYEQAVKEGTWDKTQTEPPKPEYINAMKLEQLQDHIDTVRRDNPGWFKAAEELTAEFHAFLDRGVEVGMFTPAHAQKLKDRGVYAPLFREMEKGGMFDPRGDPLKQRKGSSRKKRTPFNQIIDAYSALIGEQNRTELMNSIIDMTELGPEGAKWAFRVPNVENSPIIGENTIRFRRNGELVTYELEPNLHRAIRGLEPLRLPDWAKGTHEWVLRKPKTAATMGYTGLRLGFQLWTNPTRDLWTALLQGEFGKGERLEHMQNLVPAMKVLFKQATTLDPEGLKLTDPVLKYWQGVIERFDARGGRISTPLGIDMMRARNAFQRKLLANDAAAQRYHLVRDFPEFLKDFLSFTESVNRVVAYERAERAAMKKYGTQNPGDIRVTSAASAEAADITVNFRKMGALGRLLNDSIPFFNASLQGMDKFGRVAFKGGKINPAAIIPALTSITAAKMGVWALFSDEKWYQELPDWEKSIFLHVPLGKILPGDKPLIFRIPMPFEWGYVFGYLPEAILDSVRTGDGEEAADALRRVIKQSMPDLVPVIPKLVHEIRANENMFQDRPIESQEMQSRLPTERYTPNTLEIYKAVSKLISHVGIDLSPVQLEHINRGMTGGLIHDLVGIPDILMGKEAVQRTPVLSRMFAPEKRRGQSVADFYKTIEKMEQVRNSAKFLAEQGKTKQAEKLLRDNSNLLGLEEGHARAYANAGVPMPPRLKVFAKARREMAQTEDPATITDIARRVLGRDEEDEF